MNDRLQPIEMALVDELAKIDSKLGEVDRERGLLLDERERVAACLTAIRPDKQSFKKKRGQPRQPCAKKAEVAAVIRELIRQNGPCPERDLIGLAEDRIREEGKSLSGFKLRYDRIREELLVATTDGRLDLAPPKEPNHNAGEPA